MPTSCVFVCGDIGRSPRMQYHAIAINHCTQDDILMVGHYDSECISHISVLQKEQKLKIIETRSSFGIIGEIFRILYLFTFKIFPHTIVVQNAPAIPSLLCFLMLYPLLKRRKQKVILDWHNLSYTIAEKKRKNIIVIWLLKKIEEKAAKTFEMQMCVSNSMQIWFDYNWQVKNIVHFPDAPFDSFRQKSCHDAGSFLSKFIPSLDWNSDERPLICLSSTSWTEDERFDILWEALEIFDARFSDCNIHLYVFITGKGPKKDEFEKKLMFYPFRHVQILTLWLNYEEYINLLASVDVGICLHESTSGLDLPMKVLDMFGCKIPVIAKNYMSIGELINHQNGKIFTTPEDLFSILYSTPLQKWKTIKKSMSSYPTFMDTWQNKCSFMF